MKKEEVIAKYGEAAWQRHLAQRRAYKEEHLEQENARDKKYCEENREKRRADHQEECRKGGKRYEKKLKHQRTGIPGAKTRIRCKHAREYRPYKDIIAPASQIHHEWIPDTSEYRGIALVETDQHMHGFVDVIEILKGEITLLTEEEVKNGKKNEKAVSK
jgi:hypothetical protein